MLARAKLDLQNLLCHADNFVLSLANDGETMEGFLKNRMNDIESNFCLENDSVGLPKDEWKDRESKGRRSMKQQLKQYKREINAQPKPCLQEWRVGLVCKAEFIGLLIITHDSRAARISGENIADADV